MTVADPPYTLLSSPYTDSSHDLNLHTEGRETSNTGGIVTFKFRPYKTYFIKK